MNYEKVSVYINEAEQWQNRPLYLELLDLLQKYDVAEGTVLRGVAGFPRDSMSKTSLFHRTKKLPLVIQFIDKVTLIEVVLPELKKIIPDHLIIRVPVEVVNRDERYSL